MDRSNNVRERLGPLIEKLKSSVRDIQTLENSIQESSHRQSCGATEEGRERGPSTISNDGHSRKLMQESIEMVKRKMFRLKLMEEDLAALDERRVRLNHHLQQNLAAQQAPPPTNVPEYQVRIAELEEENRILREKSVLVDSLRTENARLAEQAKDVELLERTLDAEKSLRQKLELDVELHHHKMNQQVDKYDGLARKFEVLTRTIANLTRALQSDENSNLTLEQSIMEAMRNLSKGNLPETIGRMGGSDSVATELTTLTWTESSILNEICTVENDDSNVVDESPFHKKDTMSQSTVETLETTIESLNDANAKLCESKSDAIDENKSRIEVMKQQD